MSVEQSSNSGAEQQKASIRKSGYQNKYLVYRQMVEATKNFSQKLEQAKASDFPKPPSEALAQSSSNKLPASPAMEAQKNTAWKEVSSVAVNPMAMDYQVPDTGRASDNMIDRVKAYEPYIRAAADRYNLPPELIAGVIWQESRANFKAVSHCGAMGLMQLMPATAASLGVDNAFDPRQNIDGGAKYLRQQIDRFGRVDFAVAAYNAGPGNVNKFGGIPPFRETQDYVPKVLGYANSYKVAGAFQGMTSPTAMRV